MEVTSGRHPKRVRVGIGQARTSVSLDSSAARSGGGDLSLKEKGRSGTIARGGPKASWRLEPTSSGRVRIYKNSRLVSKDGRTAFGSERRPVVVNYAKHGSLLHLINDSTRYRYGRFMIEPYDASCTGGHCLRMINVLPMQQYLLGVSEVSPYWPRESQKVQAILSRTYVAYTAMTKGQHRAVCNCVVYDNSYDQVFIGDDHRTEAGAYWPRWRRAVRKTNGTVVLHKGKPILAVYSSSSGGHTENNENVWGGTPLPYLRGVKDPTDSVSANVRHSWRFEMSWKTFSSKLNAAYGTGRLQKFVVKDPLGVSGRVTVVKSTKRGGVKIVGSERTVRVGGYSVKSALGLYDSLFTVKFVY